MISRLRALSTCYCQIGHIDAMLLGTRPEVLSSFNLTSFSLGPSTPSSSQSGVKITRSSQASVEYYSLSSIVPVNLILIHHITVCHVVLSWCIDIRIALGQSFVYHHPESKSLPSKRVTEKPVSGMPDFPLEHLIVAFGCSHFILNDISVWMWTRIAN